MGPMIPDSAVSEDTIPYSSGPEGPIERTPIQALHAKITHSTTRGLAFGNRQERGVSAKRRNKHDHADDSHKGWRVDTPGWEDLHITINDRAKLR